MASSQKSAAKQQVKLLIELKEKVDLVYKQLNQYRGACRSVDRLNRAVRRTGGQLDPDRMLAEFVKFERDYRISRKRFRKLDRQLLAVNLYDKLYDLYESLVKGESIGTGGDLIDSSAIVVDCNGPVGNEDTSVGDFVCISIDPYTQIDEEMDLMEDACLEPRQSETLNHSLNKSSTDLWQSSSFQVVSDSTRVTRQQTRRNECNDLSAIVVGCNGPVGIEDTPVDVIADTERHVQCPQCDKSFKTSSGFSKHKRTHESQPRFKCKWEGCDYGTHRNELFKAHQTVHTGKHRFKCSSEGCGYGTNKIDNLKDHQTVHSDERPFQCSQCDKSFKTSSDLSSHKRIHESEPRFKCSWEGCDYGTNYSQSLKDHQTVHTGERSLQCPLCDKSFETSSSLRDHMRAHEIKPRFRCSWVGCDYSTHENYNLKVHQTVHSDERPFQCPQCDKSFKTSSVLWNHKRTHESEHRFRCSWVGCDFRTHHNHKLKVHQTVHTGERPFQCSQCDKTFKTFSHFCTHKRTHESEPRFKCSWVGCDFGSHHLVSLTRHQNRHLKPKLKA